MSKYDNEDHALQLAAEIVRLAQKRVREDLYEMEARALKAEAEVERLLQDKSDMRVVVRGISKDATDKDYAFSREGI